jgi:plastocyanin
MMKAKSRGEHSVRICLAVWLLGVSLPLLAQEQARPQPAAAVPQVKSEQPAPAVPGSAEAAAMTVHGQLSLSSGGRPLRSEEAQDAVVYFRPDAVAALVVPAKPFVIATERKTFVPRVLPIPVGASVRFPNNDPILHNVFSSTREASFDLGLYGRSDGESYHFTQPGVIRVFCNVHHAMVAYVLVLDTPYYTKPDAQGRFSLKGIPAGPGELFVWHERSQLWRSKISPDANGEIKVQLDLSKRRVPPHLNKTGQPYRRTRPDEY